MRLLNLKNFLSGDIHGTFCNGEIHYERLSTRNVIEDLPTDITVDYHHPMNIFRSATPDAIASLLPMAKTLARMAVVTGRKASAAR